MTDSTRIDWRHVETDDAVVAEAKRILADVPHAIHMVPTDEVAVRPYSFAQIRRQGIEQFDVMLPLIEVTSIYSGEPFIIDGQHRYTAALMRKQKTVPVVRLTQEETKRLEVVRVKEAREAAEITRRVYG
jgi:hypothetical protein